MQGKIKIIAKSAQKVSKTVARREEIYHKTPFVPRVKFLQVIRKIHGFPERISRVR